MNSLLLIIGLTYAFAAPTPEPYRSIEPFDSTSRGIQYSPANTKILSQINKHNDDGSYTFGYESEDGSFRIENKGVDGFVTGKYGYIDVNGELQEFEYVAGAMNGRSVGYQARGSAIPDTSPTKKFPAMYHSSASVNQNDRDQEYLSTDDDRDSFPDKVIGSLVSHNPGHTNIVRLTNTQAQTALENPSNMAHLTSPVQTSVDNPFNVVRLTTPGETSFQNPSNVVRFTSFGQASLENPSETVQLVNPAVFTEQKASVVRLTSSDQNAYENPSNTIRFVNGAQFSNQQQVVRLTAPKNKIAIQPTRVSNGGYQVIKQKRQRKPQFVQSVSRPNYSNNGGQRIVSPSFPLSSGRINPFLGDQATIARDNYGRWIVRGNIEKANRAASVQTTFIDDDDFDNDFDDDDFQYFTTF